VKTILIAFMVIAFAFSMTACMDRGEERDDERESFNEHDNDHREQKKPHDDDDD
jgi:hypothetical protein